jgi:hypothetical protein
MTPIEIHEYKLRWKPGYTVRLHSDLDWRGKDWCRKHLERHQWSFEKWTNVYEHTFCFENEEHGKQFEKLWPEFTNQ